MSNYVKETCPNCKYLFMAGFSNDHTHICPNCKKKFLSNLTKYRGTNNVYYENGCPAIMSDGRFVTYHGSTNELTDAMRKLSGIKSSNKFRTFLQENGDKIMNVEKNYLARENTCSPSSIACSEGWYDLWKKNGGSWSNFNS